MYAKNMNKVALTHTREKINTNPFTRCFNGFDKFFKYNQPMAILLLVLGALSGLSQVFDVFSKTDQTKSGARPPAIAPSDIEPAAIAGIVVVILLLMFASMAIGTIVWGFMNFVAYKTSRNETTTFNEAVKTSVSHFWTIVAVGIITFFKIFGGLLLFVVPGVRASLRYKMVLFPVFDEDLKARQTIKRIKELTHGHLIEIFGVLTAASLIPIIGTLLELGGQAIMYPELKTLKASGQSKPAVHWLNYLGFYIIFVILLLVLGVVAVVAGLN